MSLLIALAAAAGSPQPGELKTFTDWIVGCDNGRACQAVALMSDDAMDGATMVVARGPEPQATPSVTINLPEGKAAGVAIDGKRLPIRIANADGSASVDRSQVSELIEAMRSGRTMAVLDAGGKTIGAPSLSGISAALLYMDDQQRRVGTQTALVRKGSKPASAVPPPPALPVVARPAVPAKPPRTITPARAEALIGPDNARCEYAIGKVEPKAFRLDAKSSLVLVDHPCGNGAYNLFSSAFIVDERGGIRPARYDTDVANPKDGENLGLVNSDYDPKTRLLSSFMKGRGLGDCGSGEEFAWDGTRFRLVKAIAMGECRGSRDYITTWRATVR